MGKSIKKKLQEAETKSQVWPSVLAKSKQEHTVTQRKLNNFDPVSVIKDYGQFAVRPLNQFVSRTKSRNVETRVNEVVRYAFNKYNVPSFLYKVWTLDEKPRNTQSIFGPIKEDYRLWYIALAQGKSLYKEYTMGILTKKETHIFSTITHSCTIDEAIWYSVVRAMDAPETIAKQISCTKLSTKPLDDWWKGVAKWFITNKTSIHVMNDLLDYITHKHGESKTWYVRDNTLKSLQKQTHDWHRAMRRSSSMVRMYPKWQGIDVPDSTIERGTGNKKMRWKFHQITTGKELAHEGNKQHHCVASYGYHCSAGHCSIWSVTKWDIIGSGWHQLTIEVRSDKAIVQVRGFANRLATSEEKSIVKEWATKSGFKLPVYYW